jgi:hypothetical protein
MAPTGHAAPAQDTQAAFTLISESAVVNSATRDVSFSIVFNKPPDFTRVDASGSQANSFQYFIGGDPAQGTFDAIIRGEEIHVSSNRLRIRNAAPPDSDPAAGGWGTIRGAVPFKVSGTVLTFSVPLSVLSDRSGDGKFAYQVESYESGSITAHVDGRSVLGGLLDTRPPVSTASLSTAPNAAGWNRTDVSVKLIATDEPGGSGVKELTFSASGGQTLPSTTVRGATAIVPPITAEGVTTLTYFATDQAGNKEPAHTQLIKVDRTAPEAIVRFDPEHQDVLVVGQDGLSGAPAGPVAPLSVVPAGSGRDDEDDERSGDDDRSGGHGELRTYRIVDAASNTLQLTLEVHKTGHQLRAQVSRLQYNGAAGHTPARNSARFEWTLGGSTRLKELQQTLRATGEGDRQAVQARFAADKGQTRIEVEGRSPERELTRPGLALLDLTTSRGALKIGV